MPKKTKHLPNIQSKKTIHDFFKTFPIEDSRFLLWEMLISSISYDETKPHMRHTFMDFYHKLQELVEANHLLLKKK
ncbi:MAG: hypothetical protein IPJ81_13505 [Chitinophagaceae bacterium]|nr:hypothetical protein [Chitinophagaceae bacterium]